MYLDYGNIVHYLCGINFKLTNYKQLNTYNYGNNKQHQQKR